MSDETLSQRLRRLHRDETWPAKDFTWWQTDGLREAADEVDAHAALRKAIRTLLADVEPADLPGRGPQLLIVRALVSEDP